MEPLALCIYIRHAIHGQLANSTAVKAINDPKLLNALYSSRVCNLPFEDRKSARLMHQRLLISRIVTSIVRAPRENLFELCAIGNYNGFFFFFYSSRFALQNAFMCILPLKHSARARTHNPWVLYIPKRLYNSKVLTTARYTYFASLRLSENLIN